MEGEILRRLDRPFVDRLLCWLSGKPKRTLRRILFHTSGKPRGIFRRRVLNRYLQDENGETFEAIYAEYREHDVLGAISEATRRDVISRLGVAPERVVNIAADVDPIFRQLPDAAAQVAGTMERFGITPGFILYTGGFDYQKNMEGLIEAYARLPGPLRHAHQLVIVCRIDTRAAATLRGLAAKHDVGDRLILTDFVPDEDLVLLQNACMLSVFPSLYEGFGMPVLEAMRCGAPTIGSNVSSIPEVVGWSEALFDPADPGSIAAKMEQALTDEAFRNELRRRGSEQAARFSWDRSAAILWDAYEAAHERRLADLSERPISVAMSSPLPPARSGIASYTDVFVELAADRAEITLFDETGAPATGRGTPAATRFMDRPAAERVYQMGNSAFHHGMWDAIASEGGVMVLHDLYLSGLINWMDANGRPGIFHDELRHAHPYWNGNEREAAIFQVPMSRRLIESADGVFVHSRFAGEEARSFYPDLLGTRIRHLPQIISVPDPMEDAKRARQRKALGLPPHGAVVITAGFVDAIKYHSELLSVFVDLSARFPEARFVFLGDGGQAFSAEELAVLDAHHGRIELTGFVEPSVFEDYVACADLAVQLRRKTRGETSRAVLDFMAAGVPVIVSEIGAFREIDPAAVCRIPTEPDTDLIRDAIKTLLVDPQERARLGAAGRSLVARENGPVPVMRAFAAGLARFAANAVQRDPETYLDEIADAVSSDGMRLDARAAINLLLYNLSPAQPDTRLERFKGVWIENSIAPVLRPPLGVLPTCEHRRRQVQRGNPCLIVLFGTEGVGVSPV